MTYQFEAFDYFEFLDLQGQPVIVRGLPLLRRMEFRSRIDRLNALAAQSDPQATFSDLYDSSPEVQAICQGALRLFSIDPDRVSLDMTRQLLFSRVMDDGQFRPGFLVDLEFPQLPSDETPAVGPPPTDAETLATIWGHVGSLQGAIDIASDPRLSGRDLVEVVNARAAALDPKSDAKRWIKHAKSKDKERGSLFGDVQVDLGTASFDPSLIDR